jgi:hypothetical protein
VIGYGSKGSLGDEEAKVVVDSDSRRSREGRVDVRDVLGETGKINLICFRKGRNKSRRERKRGLPFEVEKESGCWRGERRGVVQAWLGRRRPF